MTWGMKVSISIFWLTVNTATHLSFFLSFDVFFSNRLFETIFWITLWYLWVPIAKFWNFDLEIWTWDPHHLISRPRVSPPRVRWWNYRFAHQRETGAIFVFLASRFYMDVFRPVWVSFENQIYNKRVNPCEGSMWLRKNSHFESRFSLLQGSSKTFYSTPLFFL